MAFLKFGILIGSRTQSHSLIYVLYLVRKGFWCFSFCNETEVHQGRKKQLKIIGNG